MWPVSIRRVSHDAKHVLDMRRRMRDWRPVLAEVGQADVQVEVLLALFLARASRAGRAGE